MHAHLVGGYDQLVYTTECHLHSTLYYRALIIGSQFKFVTLYTDSDIKLITELNLEISRLNHLITLQE